MSKSWLSSNSFCSRCGPRKATIQVVEMMPGNQIHYKETCLNCLHQTHRLIDHSEFHDMIKFLPWLSVREHSHQKRPRKNARLTSIVVQEEIHTSL